MYKELPGVYSVNRNFDIVNGSKFVILKPKNGELLMVTSSNEMYHAQAVLSFMKENNISSVVLSGGGLFNAREKITVFRSESGSFGKSSVYDQTEVVKQIERFDGGNDNTLFVDGHCGVSINNGGGKNYTLSEMEDALRSA